MPKREVHLTWEGKPALVSASPLVGGPLPRPPLRHPCRIEEEMGPPLFQASEHRGAPQRIIHGDAADVARALLEEGFGGGVDTIYFDPPYASGVDYSHEERFEGSANGRVSRTVAYGDKWDDAASYLDMLYPRLAIAKGLLKETGAIWIQVDWRANYLVRALCDEIFGRERFLNEIVWRRAPNLGRQARSGQFGRTLDTIIVYGASAKTRLIPSERLTPVAKGVARKDETSGRFFTLAPRGDYTDASVARLEREGRVHRSATGKISIKYWLEQGQGGLCKRQPVDSLWSDIPPLRHASPEERTGYPTQKPRALLERIISASSPLGGLVLDLFAGSGTTGGAAAHLGRGFILGDASPVAIGAMRSRLLRDGVRSLSVESCGVQAAEASVTVHAEPHGENQMRVTFTCSPGEEPIAWGVSAVPRGPFRPMWHAERSSGRKGGALVREALVPRSERVRVRVYLVSGAVADTCASLTTHDRPAPIPTEAST